MTGTALPARVLPPALTGARRARYLLERNLLVYRRIWYVILSGFFEPLFYLFSIGIGIGALAGDVAAPDGTPIPFAMFVAPGLLAASAMNGAVYESTMNIFSKLKWAKTYDSMLSTPIEPIDIAVGEIVWSQLRGFLYAAGFLVVMVALGLMPSWWGILALPGSMLIGFAFAGAGMAATTYMRSWQDFDLVQLVILPLFLLSATFFPLDVYPPALRPFIQLSPLYHGVALLRSLVLGAVDATLLGHVAFLALMAVVGLRIANRRLGQLLRP